MVMMHPVLILLTFFKRFQLPLTLNSSIDRLLKMF
jgi:hypothetical protein